MKRFFVGRAWRYYAITFILITVLFLFRNTNELLVGVAGRYGFSDSIILPLVIGISFVTAFHMGYKNIRLKCLYPVLVVLLAYLVLPIIGFVTYERASAYYFMYYLVLGFFFIFLPHIFLTFLGLGLGVFIRRRCMKKEQHIK